LMSHMDFANKALASIENMDPDLIYAVLPPNSLAKCIEKFHIRHPRTKIVLDIMDLWPETLPNFNTILLPMLVFWRGLRDRNLDCSNLILTECDLFQEVLKKHLVKRTVSTVHLAKYEDVFAGTEFVHAGKLHLCYLGSINNIIDITAIRDLASAIGALKPVVIHVIGEGETRRKFIAELGKAGAEVIYEGVVYDAQAKQRIFNQCHFGLNIMKEAVVVGLTIKSIDYLQAGLPIINSIPADTEKIVRDRHVGYQFIRSEIMILAKTLAELSSEEIFTMRVNARAAYQDYFSQDAFEKSMDIAFGKMV
jgi:hypothetical protein